MRSRDPMASGPSGLRHEQNCHLRSTICHHEALLAHGFTCFLHHSCKSGKRHKMCSSAVDDASYYLVIRLGPKTSECEKNVIVMSTVRTVKCPTLLQHYMDSTSTHRRVATLRKNTKFAQSCRIFDSFTSPYVVLVTQLVTRFHRASCQVTSSQ